MTVRDIASKEELTNLKKSGAKIIIDFWAPWCGPCKVIAPKFKLLAEKFPDVIFVKVNADEGDGEDIADEHGLESMPSFMFFKGSEKVDELIGADPGKLETKVTEFAAQNETA
eukprot:GDKH01002714.1.p2 GENE.GDKH01002714.1~~GDKH01002714.1.p2  ORF type:complete len:113 (+),score=30.02 GDKH01002714.1:165-503(+)